MADILIRGMEMPKERNLWLCIKTDGTVYNIKPGGLGTAHAVGIALQLPVMQGEWIEPDDDYGYLVCSVCEERSPNDERWNFCPNCGADMRG